MITEEYIPFHKVIALLEDFTNRHFVLNSFGFGNLLEYGQDIEEKENLDPVLFVVPQNVIYNEQETQFSFSIVIADRLSEDLRNRISAISNMSAIGKDLVSEIKLGEFQEYFDVDLPINATTFIERFEDNVGGVALDITLTTLDPLNVCEKVISVSPTPTPSITSTPTFTPTQTTTPPAAFCVEYTYTNEQVFPSSVIYYGCCDDFQTNLSIVPGNTETFCAREIVQAGANTLVSSGASATCSAEIPCPTPTQTPTPSITPTFTPTPTITPTATPNFFKILTESGGTIGTEQLDDTLNTEDLP